MQSPPKLRVVFAARSPLAAIVVAYSARLSRIVLWDTKTDKITRSTWLKARVLPLDISADGEHLAYYAEAAAKGLKGYLAISRPPYSTALYFQPCLHLLPAWAMFGRKRELLIAYSPGTDGWEPTDHPFVSRMEPNCPYDVEIVETDFPDESLIERFAAMRRESGLVRENSALWPDEYRQMIDALRSKGVRANQCFAASDQQGRLVFSPGNGCLYAIPKGAAEPRMLFDFSDREFEAVVPPEWATKWTWKRPKGEFPG